MVVKSNRIRPEMTEQFRSKRSKIAQILCDFTSSTYWTQQKTQKSSFLKVACFLLDFECHKNMWKVVESALIFAGVNSLWWFRILCLQLLITVEPRILHNNCFSRLQICPRKKTCSGKLSEKKQMVQIAGSQYWCFQGLAAWKIRKNSLSTWKLTIPKRKFTFQPLIFTCFFGCKASIFDIKPTKIFMSSLWLGILSMMGGRSRLMIFWMIWSRKCELEAV